MKKCNKCNEIKELQNFSKKRSSGDGFRTQCKKCDKVHNTEYSNEPKNILKQKQYDKERSLDLRRLLKRREYGQKLENISARKKYLNQPGIKENRNKRDRERYNTDFKFKLTKNLRINHRRLFMGVDRTSSALKVLGCSIEFFQKYIISQFVEGMTLENYGRKPRQWSLDHIIPLSKININDEEQIIKASHYTNLRPMWHCGIGGNISKGNKI
jgi:hypothetical protein